MIGIFLCNLGLNYNQVINPDASTAGQSVGLLLIITKAS